MSAPSAPPGASKGGRALRGVGAPAVMKVLLLSSQSACCRRVAEWGGWGAHRRLRAQRAALLDAVAGVPPRPCRRPAPAGAVVSTRARGRRARRAQTLARPEGGAAIRSGWRAAVVDDAAGQRGCVQEAVRREVLLGRNEGAHVLVVGQVAHYLGCRVCLSGRGLKTRRRLGASSSKLASPYWSAGRLQSPTGGLGCVRVLAARVSENSAARPTRKNKKVVRKFAGAPPGVPPSEFS